MKLELDKRIDSLSDILNFSDVENARKFIGQKGYFTNTIYFFKNIQSCKYGTLINVFSDGVLYNTFCRKEDGAYYEFFIPESRLKLKEKEFRPYTLEEFLEKFHLGDGMIFRPKNHRSLEFHVVYNGYAVNTGSNVIQLYLNSGIYTLPELFQSYERFYNGRWFPFGVEAEVEE